MDLDPYARHQRGFHMADMFPQGQVGICACGCGAGLTGRRTRWATKSCEAKSVLFYRIVNGDSAVIRGALNRRDNGVCAHCNQQKPWQADHIVPVHKGGGGCDLDNFQTLCDACHKKKTAIERSFLRKQPPRTKPIDD